MVKVIACTAAHAQQLHTAQDHHQAMGWPDQVCCVRPCYLTMSSLWPLPSTSTSARAVTASEAAPQKSSRPSPSSACRGPGAEAQPWGSGAAAAHPTAAQQGGHARASSPCRAASQLPVVTYLHRAVASHQDNWSGTLAQLPHSQCRYAVRQLLKKCVPIAVHVVGLQAGGAAHEQQCLGAGAAHHTCTRQQCPLAVSTSRPSRCWEWPELL